MDNFSEKPKNGGPSVNSGTQPKPDKRWTLIFIGNHGKTITLKRFKGMVLLACLVLCVSIAITAGLLYFSLNIRQEKKQLESDLLDLKTQIKTIRHEKDVLMTKLVLAESRSPSIPAKKPQKQSESAIPQQNTNTYEESRQSTQHAKIQEETALEKIAEPPAAENQSKSNLSVAIENFGISARSDENLLRVQFKIKNTSPNSQRVSGHTIVVLKGEALQQTKWLSIPGVSLSDGKPTGRQRGYSFGINYFKTMRIKTNLPKSPEIYQSATVFIFTPTGDLLLEQDFPVKFPAASAEDSTAPPASDATSPPSQTNSSAAPSSADELLVALPNPTLA